MPRGLLIAINTLLALALAEGGARLAERARAHGNELEFAYSPYRMLKMTQAPFPLNREGFRARELNTYRNSFLIEFLGGSVCVGVGDHPGKTVPERLQEELQDAGLVQVEVLNLCQGGATSAEELAILIEYGLPLHPAAVLSFGGANDLLHPRPIGEDDAPNLPYDNAQLEARINGQDGWSHLAMFRVATRLSARFRPPAAAPGQSVQLPAILDSYFYHLGLERTLSESQGALFAVLLEPTLHLDKPWSREEAAMWSTRRRGDAEALSAVIHERYGEMRGATARWSESTAVRLYDLTRTFGSVPQAIYSDSVHFCGSRGNELLEGELKRQGLIDLLIERYRTRGYQTLRYPSQEPGS